MADKYIKLICDKLNSDFEYYQDCYKSSGVNQTTKHIAIDGLLPEDVAVELFNAFPKESDSWRSMKSFRESKLTSKDFTIMPSILKDITFALQDESVIKIIEKITGLSEQSADPTLYAGGLSMMTKGDFLQPHIDNSHDGDRKLYRRLNLLYYVTPEWAEQDGGHLELWDTKVHSRDLIESKFNRLVLMETNSTSWHSVNKVNKEAYRCCVSNYYFSEKSPNGLDYFHITAFMARPEEKIKRFVSRLDNTVRTSLRRLVKKGVGKKDIYDAKKEG